MTLETFSITLMVLGGIGFVFAVVICLTAVVRSNERIADAAEDQAEALEAIAREVVAYSRPRR